jgi:hypothetical protein
MTSTIYAGYRPTVPPQSAAPAAKMNMARVMTTNTTRRVLACFNVKVATLEDRVFISGLLLVEQKFGLCLLPIIHPQGMHRRMQNRMQIGMQNKPFPAEKGY